MSSSAVIPNSTSWSNRPMTRPKCPRGYRCQRGPHKSRTAITADRTSVDRSSQSHHQRPRMVHERPAVESGTPDPVGPGQRRGRSTGCPAARRGRSLHGNRAPAGAAAPSTLRGSATVPPPAGAGEPRRENDRADPKRYCPQICLPTCAHWNSHSGCRTRMANGGSVNTTDAGRPCQPSGQAQTPPPLPMPLP